MKVDKYLEKVTNRLSFNYFAFQATTLFCVFVASYIAIFQFVGNFYIEDLFFCFRAFLLTQIIVVLVVTFLEFIFFSVRKKLSQKLFSKSLILIHVLFTYLFYSVLMLSCPNEYSTIGQVIAKIFFLAIFLRFITILFTPNVIIFL